MPLFKSLMTGKFKAARPDPRMIALSSAVTDLAHPLVKI